MSCVWQIIYALWVAFEALQAPNTAWPTVKSSLESHRLPITVAVRVKQPLDTPTNRMHTGKSKQENNSVFWHDRPQCIIMCLNEIGYITCTASEWIRNEDATLKPPTLLRMSNLLSLSSCKKWNKSCAPPLPPFEILWAPNWDCIGVTWASCRETWRILILALDPLQCLSRELTMASTRHKINTAWVWQSIN